VFNIPSSTPAGYTYVRLAKAGMALTFVSQRLELVLGDQIAYVDNDSLESGASDTITMALQGVVADSSQIESIVIGQESRKQIKFYTTDVFYAKSWNILPDNKIRAVFDIPASAQPGNYSLTIRLKDNTTWYYGKLSGITIKQYLSVGDESLSQSLRIVPNPASDNSTIQFSLGTSGTATFTIVSALGETVSAPVSFSGTEGSHSINLNARDLPNGVYFVRMAIGNQVYTSKFTIAR
jgi:hypothetical protein